MLSITGRRLQEIRSGLALMKERRLPDGYAEILVASIWGLLRPAFDEFDDVARKLLHEQQAAAQIEDEQERAEALYDLLKRDNALADHLYQVPSPKTKLSAAHLPKPHKGEAGQMNPAGNAAIAIALSPEFFTITPLDTQDAD